MTEKYIWLSPLDNVEVAIESAENIPFGHKRAICDILQGENIIKYGFSIGKATEFIKAGSHVHTHNMKTNLGLNDTYEYLIEGSKPVFKECEYYFDGYVRENGKIGIRNEIWILPTVGCVNKTAEIIERLANSRFSGLCDGIHAFTHPFGCSQMGEDEVFTQKTLAALAHHPNAAGVLVLSLGCENNNLDRFKPYLGKFDPERIHFLVAQRERDEIEAALSIIEKLVERAQKEERHRFPASSLTIGFKCGGSDAFSGITANPLCGRITDLFTSFGGKVMLTEVPEMFGAEKILLERSENRAVFEKGVKMINDFKDYYTRHNQVIYENPSPGNKEGGITTLEEKSLGCIQKGGKSTVTGVLDYSEECVNPGLNLLTGPGNDIVSCTNLTAAGADLILFTTGRGTPLGAPVPTIKISTNSSLAERKAGWIDYDAGKILDGMTFEEAAEDLLKLILETASGMQTKNERNGYREIAIFKDGVTL